MDTEQDVTISESENNDDDIDNENCNGLVAEKGNASEEFVGYFTMKFILEFNLTHRLCVKNLINGVIKVFSRRL